MLSTNVFTVSHIAAWTEVVFAQSLLTKEFDCISAVLGSKIDHIAHSTVHTLAALPEHTITSDRFCKMCRGGDVSVCLQESGSAFSDHNDYVSVCDVQDIEL